MPLGSNVQISFSQLQSEFGGTGEIRLSDYTSTFAYDTLDVFILNAGNVTPHGDSSFIPHKGIGKFVGGYPTLRPTSYNVNRAMDPITVFSGMNLKFRVRTIFTGSTINPYNYSPNNRIYLSSTPYKGNVDLLTTGVTGNPGNGIKNAFEYMVLDTSSYIPNDFPYDPSNVATVRKWLKTEANSNIFTSDLNQSNIHLQRTPENAIPIKIISRPSVQRVRMFSDYVDITWPSNLISGSDVIKLNSGGFDIWKQYYGFFSGRAVRIGQNITFKVNVSALPSVYSTGTYLGIYFPIFPITSYSTFGSTAGIIDGAPFLSLGTGRSLGWFSSNGPIVSFIGGSGLSNTAENVAQCLADAIGTSPRAADYEGITGLTASASRSGNTLTVTLYNNTSDNLYFNYYAGATDNSGSFLVGYYNSALVFSYSNDTSGWSSVGQSTVFGANLVCYVDILQGNIIFSQASFICPAQSNVYTLSTNLLNRFKNRFYSKAPAGPYESQYGYQSLTNGIRIISGINYDETFSNVFYYGADSINNFFSESAPFDSKKVSLTGNYLTPGPGSSNFNPNITNFSNNNFYIDTRTLSDYTGLPITSTQNYNHYVKQLKKDMSLSDYWNGYGNVALGL